MSKKTKEGLTQEDAEALEALMKHVGELRKLGEMIKNNEIYHIDDPKLIEALKAKGYIITKKEEKLPG